MATPNTYPFANQNIPDSSVKIGGRQEPLGEVMGTQEPVTMYKRGGKVKKYAEGGSIDGCAQRGKTKGRMV